MVPTRLNVSICHHDLFSFDATYCYIGHGGYSSIIIKSYLSDSSLSAWVRLGQNIQGDVPAL